MCWRYRGLRDSMSIVGRLKWMQVLWYLREIIAVRSAWTEVDKALKENKTGLRVLLNVGIPRTNGSTLDVQFSAPFTEVRV